MTKSQGEIIITLLLISTGLQVGEWIGNVVSAFMGLYPHG